MISGIFEFQNEQVHKNIQVPMEQRQQFWSHWRKFMPAHPAMYGKRHSPIGISGDDAQWNLAGAKVIVILMSFVLQEVQSLDLCRFPLFVLRHELTLGVRTMHPVWRVLAWSLNIAYAGLHPRCGPEGRKLDAPRLNRAGTRLEGGPYALVECRGDWKWHAETWALKRHYTASAICHFCFCTKAAGPHQWANFENFDQVPRISHWQFYLKSLGQYVNPLTGTVGFTPHHISFCTMHISNLGLCAWLNASVILILLQRGCFGGPGLQMGQRLQILTLRFRRWCSIHRIGRPLYNPANVFFLRFDVYTCESEFSIYTCNGNHI